MEPLSHRIPDPLAAACAPERVRRQMVQGALERARGPRAGAMPLMLKLGALATVAAAVAAFFVTRATDPTRVAGRGVVLVAGNADTDLRAAGRPIHPGATPVGLDAVSASGELMLHSGIARFEVHQLSFEQSLRIRTPQVLVEAVDARLQVAVEQVCTVTTVDEGTAVLWSRGLRASLGAGQARSVCSAAVPLDSVPGEELVREALMGASSADRQALLHSRSLLERYVQEHPAGFFEEEALFYSWVVDSRLGEGEATNQSAARFLARFPQTHRAGMVEAWRKRVINSPTPGHTPE